MSTPRLGNEASVDYRADHLGAMLEPLRQRGVEVDDHVDEHEFGRFDLAVEGDGGCIELRQPAPGH